VVRNGQLAAISGVGSLARIGGDLAISGCGRLLTIADAFSGLNNVGGDFYLGSNNRITSMSAFHPAAGVRIGGGCYVDRNSKLATIPALGRVQAVGGRLRVNSNPTLTVLRLEMLVAANGLRISNNEKLAVVTVPVASLVGGGSKGDVEIYSNAVGLNAADVCPAKDLCSVSSVCRVQFGSNQDC
jgi:hypothetical protein